MPPREVFSIICDDIRFEEGNKITLIGTYTDGILASTIPIVLPKLCLAQQILDTAGTKTVKVRLKGPKLNISVESEVDNPNKPQLRVNIIFTNVRFEVQGDYSFEVYLNEEREPAIVKAFFVHLRPESQMT